MLSYMLPIEEKPTSPRNLNLSLNLNGNNNHHNHSNLCDDNSSDETTKLLLNSERSDCINKNNFLDKTNKDNNGRIDGIIVEDTKKYKLGGKTGTNKNVTLKRVSFGSSTLVETLVFETPTPLPEHAERDFSFSPSDSHNNFGINGKSHIGSLNNGSLDDSGIGLQEEVERSKVRVTFFQSSKPQQVSPPENHIPFFGENNNSILIEQILSETNSIDDKMAATVAVTIPPNYDRQISTESGWDNPFRPGGDLSREADEIVNLIKGGKPITPTGEPQNNISNGEIHQKPSENGTTVVDGAVKIEAPKLQSSQNGTKSPQKQLQQQQLTEKKPATNGDTTNKTQTQISNQVLPTPQSASHVIIEDKKKKKCQCCVIQ